MTLAPTLLAASEAAERCVTLLAAFNNAAEKGNTGLAYAKLYSLRCEIREHGPALESAWAQFAKVADNAVMHPAISGPSSSPSAHEAVAKITTYAVLTLIEIPGLGESEAPKNWEELGAEMLARFRTRFQITAHILQTGIRRERAKLIDGGEPLAEQMSPTNSNREKITWQEAAKRMNELRSQGQPFSSQPQLARLFKCSSGTINKAIRSIPELSKWAKREIAAKPKAQSITRFVTDNTAQDRELSPENAAAIAEYRDRDLSSDVRAFFDSLSQDDQIGFLEDPDRHHRILARKA